MEDPGFIALPAGVYPLNFGKPSQTFNHRSIGAMKKKRSVASSRREPPVAVKVRYIGEQNN